MRQKVDFLINIFLLGINLPLISLSVFAIFDAHRDENAYRKVYGDFDKS